MSIFKFILFFILNIKILNIDFPLFKGLKFLFSLNKVIFQRYTSEKFFLNNTLSNYTECNQTLMGYSENGEALDLNNILFFSGKDTNDIGNERECLERNGTYIILGYTHFKDNIFYNNIIDRIKLLSFLYQPISFLGICLDNCSLLFLQTFFGENDRLNYFEDDLKINLVYKNYTLPQIDVSNYPSGFSEHYKFKDPKYIVLIIISSIIIIKIIAKIIQLIRYPKGYELEGKKKINIKGKIEKKKNENNNSNIENYLNKYSGISNYNPEFDLQSFFPKNIRIIKYLDIVDNFNVLFIKYNRYYNSVGLEKLIFIKFIIMFIITYIHLLIAIMNFPYRDNYDFDIFSGIDTFIYKLFNSSTTFFIIIEGAIFSYKIICELDKNNHHIIYIVLKFFLLSIPRIIFFYLSFFFFKYLYFYFISLSENIQVFNYYHHFLIQNRKCLNYTIRIFIPFIFPLTDFQNTLIRENENENFCYEYVNIFYNEFHSFIIMLFLFFISYKLKNKKFDKIITTLIFNLFFLFQILIFYKGEDNRVIGFYKNNQKFKEELILKYSTGMHDYYYKLYNKLFFQNYYEKYLPSNLFFYHLGFLLGICNFYNNINKEKDNKKNFNKYYPFSYIYNDLYKFFSHIIIFIISCILMFFCSLSYYLSKKEFDDKDKEKYNLNGNNDKNIYKFSNIEWFYFSFEKGLFGILFFFIVAYVIKKQIYISKFRIFNFIDRISFTYYCILDGIIYFILSLCFVMRNIDSQSFFYLTFALYFIGAFISFIVVSVFEYSGRIIIKHILREYYLN